MSDIKQSDVLTNAAAVAEILETCGTEVITHYSNGRRAVLIIDKPPVFVKGAMRRRESDGQGGYCRVMAANFHGLQIEWREQQVSRLGAGCAS